MSGHAGMYCFSGERINPQVAESVSAGLSQEGPDGAHAYVGPGIFMAFRTFGFDKLSRMERQPYELPNGTCITFDGRLDNRESLILLLTEHLHPSKVGDPTDVELALAAYQRWGEEGLNRLLGDWSLAIWDSQRRAVVLASDYIGSRSLFYCLRQGFLAWSSNLAQIVEWLGVYDDLDPSYIATYLTQNCGNDRTMYRGIQHVPCGGAILVGSDGKESQSHFWKLAVDTRVRYRTDSDYEEHLLFLFQEAIRVRLRTDQVVCCDLSGGLDSSSVTCMAHHLIKRGIVNPARLVTLSITGIGGEEDMHFADIVEKHCNIEGIHLSCPCDMSLDQPAGPLPTWKLSQAREVRNARHQHSVRVSLTGFGGDDLLGNSLDEPGQLAEHLRSGQLLSWARESYGWARARRTTIWPIMLRSVVPLLPASMQQSLWAKDPTPDDSYAHLAKEGLVSSKFVECHLDIRRSIYSHEYHRASPDQRYLLYCFERLRSYHGMSGSPYVLPVKTSHAFFHRPLFDFCTAIPRRQLCRSGRTRDLMRRAFKGLLPTAILERKTKSTTRATFEWNLEQLAPALLQNPGGLVTETRGYASAGRLTQALRNPQALDFQRSDLMPLLCLEVWLQTRDRRPKDDAPRSII